MVGEFDEFPIVEGEEKRESFEEFPPIDTTPGQKLMAVGQGATGAFAETAPILGGMAMGAQLGALGGPAAPVTVPAGAAVGGLAGFLFGQKSRELLSDVPLPSGRGGLTFNDVNELPPGSRPFGVAGEVIGGGIPFTAAPLVAARAGARLPASKVGNFINRIIDSAARSPGTTSAMEISALQASAVAGGVAQAFLPGDTAARVGAEVAGGFLNPLRLVIGATKGTSDTIRAALETMTEEGRRSRAARVLRDIVEEAGEDPELLATLLNDSGLPGLDLTAAQKTGSPALVALESKLRAIDPKFGRDAAKMAAGSLDFIKNAITVLRQTGDPAAFRAAAELRSNYFRLLVAGRLQAAEREATEAATGIAQDSPRAVSQLSRNAQEAAESSLREVRAVESDLWGLVDRNIPAEGNNVIAAFDRIRADLLPEEVMPPVVEGFVRRIRGEPDVTDVEAQRLIQEVFGDAPSIRPPGAPATDSGELLRFRSRALALAREAAANNRFNDARILGELAEAALDDLSGLGGGAALDDARTFSRELHDTFTRTFAGQATATTSTGAARVPPELFMRRAFATGREAAELRMREVEEATRFLARRGLDTEISQQNLEIVLDSQERIMRLAANEVIDPNTGRASATRLGNFLERNQVLLDRFPEVRADIQQAINAENGLSEAERLLTGATRVIDQKATFAKVAKFENASDAVATAVLGREPIKDLLGMVKLAKRGGVEATEGLKVAVLDHALRQVDTANFSFAKFRDSLFGAVRPGQPSLAEIMQRSGVMTKKEINSIKGLLDRADNIVTTLQRGGSVDEFIENPDALFDLVLRVAGARLGAQGATGAAAGSSLVAAGAGSRFLRNVFSKVPNARVKDVLIEASKNPRFAAMLLREAPSATEKLKLSRQIHGYLFQAGLMGPEEEPTPDDLEFEERPEALIEETGEIEEAVGVEETGEVLL